MATIKADPNGCGQQSAILKSGVKASIEFQIEPGSHDGDVFSFQIPDLAMNKPCKYAGGKVTVDLLPHETIGLNLQNYYRVIGLLAGKPNLVACGRLFFE